VTWFTDQPSGLLLHDPASEQTIKERINKMARNQKTTPSIAVLPILSALIVGAPVAAAPILCDEGMNQIWSVEDATSFEAIESQLHALIVNSSDEQDENFVNFPDEGDNC
jgi:hypothetical protein